MGLDNEVDDDGWEYVEEGPSEIIWQGNEIIVKKKKSRVKKKDTDQQNLKEVSLAFYTDILNGSQLLSVIWLNQLIFQIL